MKKLNKKTNISLLSTKYLSRFSGNRIFNSRCAPSILGLSWPITILVSLFFCTSVAKSATNYVSLTGGHISPFDSWETAATNIQDAVDTSFSGDIVLVTNGTYYPADQIYVTYNITVKSVNGAKVTIVDGSQSNRCFYINSDNTIDGFTITNGYILGSGGGVYYDFGGTVQNCTISGNSASEDGGGVNCCGGTVKNCTISGNSARNGGGAGCYGGSSIVKDCTISKNFAFLGSAVFCNYGTVQNCTIITNTTTGSGSVYCLNDSIIQDSTFIGNSGGVYCHGSKVRNCTFIGNSSHSGGGIRCDYGVSLQ